MSTDVYTVICQALLDGCFYTFSDLMLCTKQTWLWRVLQCLQLMGGLSDALLLTPQPSAQVLHSRPAAKVSPCRGCKQPVLGDITMLQHHSTAAGLLVPAP